MVILEMVVVVMVVMAVAFPTSVPLDTASSLLEKVPTSVGCHSLLHPPSMVASFSLTFRLQLTSCPQGSSP